MGGREVTCALKWERQVLWDWWGQCWELGRSRNRTGTGSKLGAHSSSFLAVETLLHPCSLAAGGTKCATTAPGSTRGDFPSLSSLSPVPPLHSCSFSLLFRFLFSSLTWGFYKNWSIKLFKLGLWGISLYRWQIQTKNYILQTLKLHTRIYKEGTVLLLLTECGTNLVTMEILKNCQWIPCFFQSGLYWWVHFY